MPRKREEILCPRCGAPVSYFEYKKVGSREYIYAVHYEKGPDGRRRKKRCYLGPADAYNYVSRTHDFTLQGLVYEDRELGYLERIINILELRAEKNPEKIPEIVQRIEEIEEKIEKTKQRLIELYVLEIRSKEMK